MDDAVDWASRELGELLPAVSPAYWGLLMALSAAVLLPFAVARAQREFGKGVIIAIGTVFLSSMLVFASLTPTLGMHLFWTEVGGAAKAARCCAPRAECVRCAPACASASLPRLCFCQQLPLFLSCCPPNQAGGGWVHQGRACGRGGHRARGDAGVRALRARRCAARLRRPAARAGRPRLAVGGLGRGDAVKQGKLNEALVWKAVLANTRRVGYAATLPRHAFFACRLGSALGAAAQAPAAPAPSNGTGSGAPSKEDAPQGARLAAAVDRQLGSIQAYVDARVQHCCDVAGVAAAGADKGGGPGGMVPELPALPTGTSDAELEVVWASLEGSMKTVSFKQVQHT